jgi:hypothetical protein
LTIDIEYPLTTPSTFLYYLKNSKAPNSFYKRCNAAMPHSSSSLVKKAMKEHKKRKENLSKI